MNFPQTVTLKSQELLGNVKKAYGIDLDSYQISMAPTLWALEESFATWVVIIRI